MGCCGITRGMGHSDVPQGHGTLVLIGTWDALVFLWDMGRSGVPQGHGMLWCPAGTWDTSTEWDMGCSGIPWGHGTPVLNGTWDALVSHGDMGHFGIFRDMGQSGVLRGTGHSGVLGDMGQSQRHLLLVPLYSMSCRERRLRFAGWEHWTSRDSKDTGQDPTVPQPQTQVSWPLEISCHIPQLRGHIPHP